MKLRLARAAGRRRSNTVDVAVAKKRIAEITARPDQIVSGAALQSRLNDMTEAPASKPIISAPVPASALPKETTMKTKSKAKSTAKKRSVGEAAANRKKAKAAGKPKRSSKKAASDNARAPVGAGGVRPGSKLEIVVGLLTRADGCTGKEILAATGWPTVSVPQQAKAAGLVLSKEKIDGITRYRATATPAE